MALLFSCLNGCLKNSFYHQCSKILIPEAAHSPGAASNLFKLWLMVWLYFGFFFFFYVGQLLDFSFSSSRLLLVVRQGSLLKMLPRGWDKQWVSQVWFLCSTAIGSLVLLCFVLVFPLVSECLPWVFEKPDGMLCQPRCCSTSARITNFPVIMRYIWIILKLLTWSLHTLVPCWPGLTQRSRSWKKFGKGK